jgi:hypothetical protein
MVLPQFLLARCLRGAWRRYLLVSAIATVAVLAAFIPDTSSPAAGILQRVAVTIPLLALAAIAALYTRVGCT